MISDSEYWKEELFRNASWLAESLVKKRWIRKSFSKLEKCIMLSAYALRKLDEANRLPPEFMGKEISAFYYPVGDNIFVNSTKGSVDKFYNFKIKNTCKLKVRFLINQIIHSYFFTPVISKKERKVTYILINSDNTKDERVYMVEYDKIINLIMFISSGSMSMAHYQFNGKEFRFLETIFKSSLHLEDIK